MADAYQPL
jgi:hypothetical protein